MSRQKPIVVLRPAEVDGMWSAIRGTEAWESGDLRPEQTGIFLRHRALFQVMSEGGLRVQEMCDLRVQDVSLAEGHISVIRGKLRKGRVVAVSDECLKHIRAHLAWAKLKPEDHLFLTDSGKPMTSGAIYQWVKGLGRRADVKKRVYPHLFRHTMAVRLCMDRIPLMHIQRQLGHTNAGMTGEYLADLDFDSHVKAIRENTGASVPGASSRVMPSTNNEYKQSETHLVEVRTFGY